GDVVYRHVVRGTAEQQQRPVPSAGFKRGAELLPPLAPILDRHTRRTGVVLGERVQVLGQSAQQLLLGFRQGVPRLVHLVTDGVGLRVVSPSLRDQVMKAQQQATIDVGRRLVRRGRV